MKKLRNIKILVLAVTVMLCVGATINAQSRKTVPAKWIEEDKWITLKLSTEGIRTINKNGLYTVVKELRKKGQHI